MLGNRFKDVSNFIIFQGPKKQDFLLLEVFLKASLLGELLERSFSSIFHYFPENAKMSKVRIFDPRFLASYRFFFFEQNCA